MFSQLLCRSTGGKSFRLKQEMEKPLRHCFSKTIASFEPKLTRPLHSNRDASFSSVSKIRVSNLSIRKQYGAILVKGDSHSLAYVRENGTFSLDINTNVMNNVFLYKYDRPRYFKYMNVFGAFQFLFWMGLCYVMCSQLPPHDPNDGPLTKYLYNNYFTVVFVIAAVFLGVGSSILIWTFTAKSVRYLILHKGGKSVSLVTYHPLNKNITTTVPIDNVKCRTCRKEMKNYLPIKLQGRSFYYILDSGGEFLNPTLFDYTVGAMRS